MQQNIGTVDRYLRLTSGILILTGGLQMRRVSLGKSALLAVGAMKIAEGVTGWCPLLSAFGVTTLEEGAGSNAQSRHQNQHESQHNQHQSQHNQHQSQDQTQHQNQHAHHEDHSQSSHAETTGNPSRTRPQQHTNDSVHEGTERQVKSGEKNNNRSSNRSSESHPAAERQGNETDQEILYS